MGPKKNTATTRGKYIASVVHDNSSTNNIDGERDNMNPENLQTLSQNMSDIDPSLLASLRGYAGPTSSAGQIPKFDPKTQDWHSFNLSLQHYLLMNNLLNHLKNTDITNANNLALFLAISNCLTGEALELAQNDALGDGQKLYKLLTSKYLGNNDAREATVLIEMGDLKLGENESIRDFITRVNKIKFQINEFKLINKTNVLSILVLRAIRDRYKVFVDNIYSSGKIPHWNLLKEKLESYVAINNIARSNNRSGNNYVANVQKRKFKKFFNKKYKCAKCFGNSHKTHECQSKLYCKICENRSHDYNNCKYRGSNSHTTFAKPSYPASRGQGRRGRYTGGPRNQNHANPGARTHNANRPNTGQAQTNQSNGVGKINNTICNTENTTYTDNSQREPTYANIYM